MKATKEKITNILRETFAIDTLKIIDDSEKHIGHPESIGSGGHFTVYIISDDFKGKTLLERHRLIYRVLMKALRNEIHALAIKAYTIEEKK